MCSSDLALFCSSKKSHTVWERGLENRSLETPGIHDAPRMIAPKTARSISCAWGSGFCLAKVFPMLLPGGWGMGLGGPAATPDPLAAWQELDQYTRPVQICLPTKKRNPVEAADRVARGGDRSGIEPQGERPRSAILSGPSRQASWSPPDRKSTRLNSSHVALSRMPSSA